MNTNDRVEPNENHPIQVSLRKLAGLADKQPEMWLRMLQAYQSKFYPMDILAMGALNRSAGLCSGFQNMIEHRNLTCAAPLLRLQLDNALRFSAAFIVADPHAFADAVVEGTPVKKLKDKSGACMTDAYLVSQLSKRYSWVEKVYNTTSGYVHLSEKHIFQAIQSPPDSDLTMEFKMSATDENLPDETFVEATDAFSAATEIFHYYIEGWIYSKANPEIMAKLREAKQKSNKPK